MLWTVVAALLLLGVAPLAAALAALSGAGPGAWSALLDERVLRLLLGTAALGATTALACAAVGVPVGRALARRGSRLAGLLATLLPLPLILPPWVAGLAWARVVRLSGFWGAVVLLTLSLWPFVALFALRGFRAAGSAGDAAALARGRRAAFLRIELPLALPSILSGMLLVFLFAITDFGVVDFLSFNVPEPFTVLSSEIFLKWGRLESAPDAAVVSLPALLLGALALLAMLAIEARHRGRERGLPAGTASARAGSAAGTAGLLAVAAAMLLPLVVLGSWAARHPDPLGTLGDPDIGHDALRSVLAAAGAGALVAVLGVAAARLSLRLSPRGETLLLLLALLPLAAPGVLFGVGEIQLWNAPWNPLAGALYRSPLLLVMATGGRYLCLGMLAARALLLRQDPGPLEAARLAGRSAAARWWRVELPLLAPATGLACALGYLFSLRELDIPSLVPAGNATLVRRIYGLVHITSDDQTALLSLLLVALVLVPMVAGRLLGVPGVDCGPARGPR
jgi:iron(III) transport system permease protein